MNNKITNFCRSIKFWFALKQGNIFLANKTLKAIESSGAKLSPLEKLYQDKLKFQESLNDKDREISYLSTDLRKTVDKLDELELKLNFNEPLIRKIDDYILTPNTKFIEFVINSFQLIEKDENLLQCTGIDEQIFYDLESSLANYIKSEVETIPEDKRILELEKAHRDIGKLKVGADPDYSFYLTPHVYFIRYFLDNVYSNYLAWYLVYQSGLLPTKINILDIGAGPGTVAYGLALFLQSSSSFFATHPMHICYYSLEKQAQFQYRGLQFWRQYIEQQIMPTNLYFRFDTRDLFIYNEQLKVLPKGFFNFITISHCLFFDQEEKKKYFKVYRKIFQESLSNDGYAIIIVQGKRIFRNYYLEFSENRDIEKKLIENLMADIGLNLVWYKYLASTGQRMPSKSREYAIFARENLPHQKYMEKLKRQYLQIQHYSSYGIDDYIILGKK